jgi:hypothetical protein
LVKEQSAVRRVTLSKGDAELLLGEGAISGKGGGTK